MQDEKLASTSGNQVVVGALELQFERLPRPRIRGLPAITGSSLK